MRKVANVKIGMLVAVPDRLCFPGRRDPYEYENGIVIAFGKNKKGSPLSQVVVYNHFTKKTYTKWFLTQRLYQVSYYHYIGEEKDFKQWLATSKEIPGGLQNENCKVSAM